MIVASLHQPKLLQPRDNTGYGWSINTTLLAHGANSHGILGEQER
jgi:hypothetical protein